MIKYETTNTTGMYGEPAVKIKTQDGRQYFYSNERIMDIVTCELDVVLAHTLNYELVNKYVEIGYVIVEIDETVTKLRSKRSLYWEKQKEGE